MKRRKQYPMPDDILEAMKSSGVTEEYEQRPVYQRNDYIGWITRAKTDETRLKRLKQMIEELHEGGVYMNMKHSPSMKAR